MKITKGEAGTWEIKVDDAVEHEENLVQQLDGGFNATLQCSFLSNIRVHTDEPLIPDDDEEAKVNTTINLWEIRLWHMLSLKFEILA